MTEDITPEQLRAWRKEHGLTQTALGDKIGLDKVAISNIETGRRGISPAEQRLLLQIMRNQQADSDEWRLKFTAEQWKDVLIRSRREGFEDPTSWIAAKIRAYLAMDSATSNEARTMTFRATPPPAKTEDEIA